MGSPSVLKEGPEEEGGSGIRPYFSWSCGEAPKGNETSLSPWLLLLGLWSDDIVLHSPPRRSTSSLGIQLSLLTAQRLLSQSPTLERMRTQRRPSIQ